MREAYIMVGQKWFAKNLPACRGRKSYAHDVVCTARVVGIRISKEKRMFPGPASTFLGCAILWQYNLLLVTKQ